MRRRVMHREAAEEYLRQDDPRNRLIDHGVAHAVLALADEVQALRELLTPLYVAEAATPEGTDG